MVNELSLWQDKNILYNRKDKDKTIPSMSTIVARILNIGLQLYHGLIFVVIKRLHFTIRHSGVACYESAIE